MTPLYSIGTWDIDKQAYTPQTVPAYNMTLAQLRQAVRDLRSEGYTAHRIRDSDGDYEDNDTNVLIERTDGASVLSIRRNWKR